MRLESPPGQGARAEDVKVGPGCCMAIAARSAAGLRAFGAGLSVQRIQKRLARGSTSISPPINSSLHGSSLLLRFSWELFLKRAVPERSRSEPTRNGPLSMISLTLDYSFRPGSGSEVPFVTGRSLCARSATGGEA